MLSGGISRFHFFDYPQVPDYRTVETRVEIRAIRHFKVFSIVTGIGYGAKFKRPSYYDNNTITAKYIAVSRRIDNAMSSSNQYTVFLPLLLRANLRASRFGVEGGLVFRNWTQIGLSPVMREEVGLALSFKSRLTNKVYLNIDFFRGLTHSNVIPAGQVTISSNQNPSRVNEYFQFSIEKNF